MNIIDKTRGAVRHGRHVGEWIVRFDKAHKGAQYPHININEAVSGIRDPHIPIGAAVENLNAVPPSSALNVSLFINFQILLIWFSVGSSRYCKSFENCQ